MSTTMEKAAKSVEAVSLALTYSNGDTAAADTAVSLSNNTEETSKTEEEKVNKMEVALWRVLTQNFAINLEEVERTQKFLNDNCLKIAVENSLGQCSTGHSCKDKA